MRPLLLLVLSLISTTSSQRLARRIDQSPNKRAQYVGSYAWTTDQVCAADWSSQCKATAISSNACCRTGETCFTTVVSYCCPTNVDCQSLVYTLPACGDPTMDMYVIQAPWYICCKSGKVAVKLYSGGAQCMDPDQNVPASLRLAKTSQVAAGTVATVATGIATAATGSATGSSSGSRTTSATGSSTSPVTNASIPTSPSTASSTAGSATSQPIGTGSIIGIAVGGGIVLLIAVLAGWKCGQNRRKRELDRQMAAMPPMYARTPEYKGPTVQTMRPVPPTQLQAPLQSEIRSPSPMAAQILNPPPASPPPASPRPMSPLSRDAPSPPPAYGATPGPVYSEVQGQGILPPELQSHTITRRPVDSMAGRYEM